MRLRNAHHRPVARVVGGVAVSGHRMGRPRLAFPRIWRTQAILRDGGRVERRASSPRVRRGQKSGSAVGEGSGQVGRPRARGPCVSSLSRARPPNGHVCTYVRRSRSLFPDLFPARSNRSADQVRIYPRALSTKRRVLLPRRPQSQ